MSRDELLEGFHAFASAPEDIRAYLAKYGLETEERWGDSDVLCRESIRRTRSYTKADWKKIQAEGEAHEARMAELLAAGIDPEGSAAMSAAEAMRQHITRWFYPCDYGTHARFADMYEGDFSFADHYEKRANGLAGFVATAILANAMRAWDECRASSA